MGCVGCVFGEPRGTTFEAITRYPVAEARSARAASEAVLAIYHSSRSRQFVEFTKAQGDAKREPSHVGDNFGGKAQPFTTMESLLKLTIPPIGLLMVIAAGLPAIFVVKNEVRV